MKAIAAIRKTRSARRRRFCSFAISAAAVACWTVPAAAAELQIPSVFVRLIDDVEVPARAVGVLTEVRVREGQIVEQGELLAKIDDSEARILQSQARIELEQARRKSENDVSVRFTRKSAEVANAELRRANESIERYPKSISASELDRLALAYQRSILEIEQAEHSLDNETLNRDLKREELKAAGQQLQRCQVVSPLRGMVVEINVCRGEWVEPGEPAMRIIRLDRLRAEGFLDAKLATPGLQGRPVKLVVEESEAMHTFPGEVVFVSPEVDPVNRQVRVWAEIENKDLRLRPGLRARLIVFEAGSSAD